MKITAIKTSNFLGARDVDVKITKANLPVRRQELLRQVLSAGGRAHGADR